MVETMIDSLHQTEGPSAPNAAGTSTFGGDNPLNGGVGISGQGFPATGTNPSDGDPLSAKFVTETH